MLTAAAVYLIFTWGLFLSALALANFPGMAPRRRGAGAAAPSRERFDRSGD